MGKQKAEIAAPRAGEKAEVFLNTGALVIDEINTSTNGKDPYILAVQPGINFQISDTASIKGAVGYLNAVNAKFLTLDGTTSTNSKTVGGALNNDYVDITPALELTMKDSLKALKIDLPYLALFGEYVDNVAPKLHWCSSNTFSEVLSDKVSDWASAK